MTGRILLSLLCYFILTNNTTANSFLVHERGTTELVNTPARGTSSSTPMRVMGYGSSQFSNHATYSTTPFLDFTTVGYGNDSKTKRFYIINISGGVLSLTGAQLVEVSGDVEFSISRQPSKDKIEGNVSGFDVKFTPGFTKGVKTAKIKIQYSSTSGSGVFDFTVRGEVTRVKTIELKSNQSHPVISNGSSSPAIVANSFTISNAGQNKISGMKVYFTDGHKNDQDKLNFVNQNGIVGNWNQASGVLTLTGEASASDYVGAIRTVTYTNISNGSASSGTRKIEYSLGSAAAFSGNGHFYEYIVGAEKWDDAKTKAENKSYFGMQGYLATITSATENNFIKQKLAGNGWIGCSDLNNEGTWKWVTGPEAGTTFWANKKTVSGQYSNWEQGEPNEYNGEEDHGHIYSSTGKWNDYKYNNGSIHGYIVEYGGTPGDPNLSSVTTSSIVNVIANRPPIAQNDGPFYVYPGATITKNVINNDSDPDNNSLTISRWNSLNSNTGTLKNKLSNGGFTYTAPIANSKNYTKNVDFSYELSDSRTTANATVSIRIVTPIWNGTANFSSSSRWNGATVPTSILKNDIIVNSGQITISDKREIKHLTLNKNAIVKIVAGGTLHIHGDFDDKNLTNGKVIIQKGGKIFLHGNYYHNGIQKIRNSGVIDLGTVLEF
ncbi:hypothetical protein EMN47_14240 [Prolixibacteraceae bacterium JC049]|nr:hypothetical protein [Prolixibacteraceae bacterium JC049]